MDEVLAMDKQVKLENVVVVKQEAERLAADRFIAPNPRLTQLLGEFLVKEGLANQQEIDAAMAMQRLNGGRLGEIAIYGQESNYPTWGPCKMNLAEASQMILEVA